MTSSETPPSVCAFCHDTISGGPGGWYALSTTLEVCEGSPTGFHEPQLLTQFRSEDAMTTRDLPERLRHASDSLDISTPWDENLLEDAAFEIEWLRAEISDLRFLIGMAVSKHKRSAWRGDTLNVTSSLYRRLRAAADFPQDTDND
jgi:hypothetical protein